MAAFKERGQGVIAGVMVWDGRGRDPAFERDAAADAAQRRCEGGVIGGVAWDMIGT